MKCGHDASESDMAAHKAWPLRWSFPAPLVGVACLFSPSRQGPRLDTPSFSHLIYSHTFPWIPCTRRLQFLLPLWREARTRQALANRWCRTRLSESSKQWATVSPARSRCVSHIECAQGDVDLAAQMFLGTLDKVYIVDKTERNPTQINGHPAWAAGE